MAYEAGRIVAELEARNGQFDATMRNSAAITEQSMSRVERSATDAERAIARSSQGIIRSSGSVQQATRNLGFQISDVGQQLSGGQSPFVIFGQQAPQFVQAFEEIAAAGANVGTVLRSIALPGILAVVSVLGTLIESQLRASDASDAHSKSVDVLGDAISRLNNQAAAENRETQHGINLDIARAQSRQQDALRTYDQVKARIALARAEQAAQNQRASSGLGGQRGEVASLGGGRDNPFNSVIAGLDAQAAAIDKQVASASRAISVGQSKIAQLAARAAADPAERVRQEADKASDRLLRAFQSGKLKISQAELTVRLARIEQEKAASLDSIKSDERSARRIGRLRTARTAGGTSAAAINSTSDLLADLRRDLDATEKQFDRLFINGRSDLDRSRDRFRQIFGDGDPLGHTVKDADRERDIRLDAATQAENMAQSVREGNIRSLANIYEDLFTQGSARAWDNFKRDGLRTIALVLAQATITSFAKGGGGFGSLLGNVLKGAQAAGGIPRFAGGGTMVIGGNAGVDSNLLSLNGRPIAAVSRGESLSISPNGRAASPASQSSTTIVNQTFTLDARYGVTTPELLRHVNQVAKTESTKAAGASFAASQRAAPGTYAQYQNLEG